MNINIHIVAEDVSIQIIDILQAYIESGLDLEVADWKLNLTDSVDLTADINIVWTNMYADINVSEYDVAIISNSGEGLCVSGPAMHQNWEKENVYLTCNSLLTTEHSLYNKVLASPAFDFQVCRDLWTKYFYPHYYVANSLKSLTRSNDIIAINGTNRTVRHHVMQLIENQTNVKVLNNISDGIINTNHSYWESPEDTEFRNSLEEQYEDVFEPEKDFKAYKSTTIGINGKFGFSLPGYSLIPEYFEYRCVVYPETTWQNNELTLTEKTAKCFYAGCLPFVVAGANVNKLFNELGYATAWNLLPPDLQSFDSELDHFKRTEQMVDAIGWLKKNAHVLQSEEFERLTRQNMIKVLTYSPTEHTIRKLIEIINERRCRH